MNASDIRQASGLTEATTPPATPGLGWLTLLTSGTTLVCCALPIALVTLGFGATVAALTSALPVLVTLSGYKTWLVGSAGGQKVIELPITGMT